ncbi:A24 family peptidase [Geobacter hydrogenophilus]|uniref:Prepilin leader peptidase/N-methyltransferase n=1 Tax=Geobacter hydrogenophilus TaxID=40983 RepID=A0A9W6FY70_9BACT|nr:A24 family peptidase [Geobacter hydrogenophilus]MBT0894958.1 A24 family peptidase [Geobacter hydrogenophilus]GLI37071.1 type 4 prepilin-like proteins leader peptide-processing enzyme [Geobacter hydrogenophilus]
MSPVVIFAIFSFLLGAAVGSFLNVCIFRLPAGESVVSPPSRCPVCGARIRPWHNIPILGWLILRGKCRDCGASISPRYPFVELLNGLLTLALFLKFGPTPTFLVLFVFCSALVAVTFIDLDHQIIPDVISLPGIVVGFACSFALPWLGWKSSLIGIVAGGGSLLAVAWLYELLTKKEGMGGGDIKLLAMMGAFLGWRSVPFIIFASSLIGSVIGVTLMLVQKKDTKLAIPFGPFLAAGAVLYIFFGKAIITWYLTLGAR